MFIYYCIFFGIIAVTFELLMRFELIKLIVKYEFKQMVHGSADVYDDIMNKKHNETELIPKTGQIAVVTGGARGIGVEIVQMLLQCDMHVVIGCRKPEVGKQVETEARQEGIKTGSLECEPLHLDSLQSVKEFGRIVSQKHPRINILINNAAILNDNREKTVDGFESHFGVNYLGHFVLTHYLLPNLMKAGSLTEKSRIVNVSSCVQYFGEINFEDINLKGNYLKTMAYSQSKLAQVISTVYLDSKFKNENIPIEVFSVNPGVVNTDMVKSVDIYKVFTFVPPLIFKTRKQGAMPIIHGAISPKLIGKGGSYINNCRIKEVNPIAKDIHIQEKLFNLSKELTSITEFGNPIFVEK